jgi:triosephosphate isomerase
VGHSEQRELSGVTDEHVRESAVLLIRHGLTAVVCIGETLAEREREETISKITRQVEVLLSGITRPGLAKLVIVYEPIWAISAQGTGQMPSPENVSEVALLIRKLIAERFGADGADKVRVLYGGSVKPENAGAYTGEPGVHGVLVGSASTSALQFVGVAMAVAAAA